MLRADLILAILWRRRAIFVLTLLAFLVNVLIVTSALPSVYSSKGYLWVSASGSVASDFEATQTNLVLVKTYAELLGSEIVAEDVATRLPFRGSGSSVRDAVSVSPVAQSQLIRVRAEASSPERARTIADVYLSIAVERAGQLSRTHAATNRVTLAQPADLPVEPVRPKPALYLVVGALLGATLAFVVAMLRDRFDTTIRPPADASELFGVPILARVAGRRRRILASARRPTTTEGRIDEALHVALVNLALLNRRRRPNSVAVTSVTRRDEGGAWARVLADAASAAGLRVVLVERVTASDSGSGHGDRTEAGESRVVDASAVDVVPPGPLTPGTSLLRGEKESTRFEREVTAGYDLRVHDAGALSTTPDAAVVASRTEATVLVVETARTQSASLERALEQLEAVDARIVGLLLVEEGTPRTHPRERNRTTDRTDVRDVGGRATAAGDDGESDGGLQHPGERATKGSPVHREPTSRLMRFTAPGTA